MLEISPRAALPEKNLLIVLLLGLIGAELLIVAVSLSFPFEVMAAIVGAWLLYFIFKNTFVSLCVLILLHYFVLRGSEQITVPEIFFGFYFCAFLGAWFCRKIFLERRPILRDGLDYALAGFLVFCALSIVPAILLGSSLLKWLRELFPFLTLLLVFPIREQADSKKRIQILIACFLLLSLAVAIDNLFSYKQALARALQFWEIASSRRSSNAQSFMAIIIVACGFFVTMKSRLVRLISFVVMIVFGIALAVTFSRGFWVAALIGLFSLFWLLPRNSKWRMAVYLGIAVLISTGVVSLFFGDLGRFILQAVGERLQSVGEAGQDVSFGNRLVEAQAVMAQIKFNPIAGFGLGKAYSYDPLFPAEMPTTYIHNTMLFLWYKVGLFGVICLFAFIGGIFFRGRHACKTEADAFLKTLLIGLIACLISLVVVSFSSPQFIDKDSTLLGALIFGLVQSIWRRQGTG